MKKPTRLWKTFDGDVRPITELKPDHLLNIVDLIEERIGYLREFQADIRREVARQDGDALPYGEGVFRELLRHRMAAAHAMKRHVKNVSDRIRRNSNFSGLFPRR